MAEWISMKQEIYVLAEEHKRIQEENNGVKWHWHIFDTSIRDSESLVNETADGSEG